MKKLAVLVLAALATAATADNYTRGYTRNDGTYVQPHHQSDPNGTKLDNYSSKGNDNPYTGRQGTVNPYKPPPYNGVDDGRRSNGGSGGSCGYTASALYVCR